MLKFKEQLSDCRMDFPFNSLYLSKAGWNSGVWTIDFHIRRSPWSPNIPGLKWYLEWFYVLRLCELHISSCNWAQDNQYRDREQIWTNRRFCQYLIFVIIEAILYKYFSTTWKEKQYYKNTKNIAISLFCNIEM